MSQTGFDQAEMAIVDNTGNEPPENSTYRPQMSKASKYVSLAILFIVNLLNYMDRYTLAGVLTSVEAYYHIGESGAGLLQSIFIIGYMIFSPIFGYLGDRMNRKILMTVGIMFWSVITLCGSFVPAHLFGLFVFLRSLVGVGEASYSTIAPTIISDMFVGGARSNALMVFYFAVPVGSGLGYIVGSNVARALGGWQWALRVTPGLGVLCSILLIFLTKEPPRGMAENAAHLRTTSIKEDLAALIKNKSFMLDTFGFTCVAFIAGALALFAPEFIKEAYSELGQPRELPEISLYFGILTCGAGFAGIIIGNFSAKWLKKRYVNGDALVCAYGLLGSAFCLFFALWLCQYNMDASWVLMAIGMTLVCLNWSLVVDIVLYTVVPTRRSTAEAFQILTGHLLGDAGSPYLIGVLAQSLQDTYKFTKFKAMQSSLYICAFIAVIGCGLFLWCSLHIEKDKTLADAITHGMTANEVDGVILAVDADENNSDERTNDVDPIIV